MIYHCGLLDEQPEKSRMLQWIKRRHWGGLPEDVERELRIFLAMPGLSLSYVAHVFRHGTAYVRPHVGGYDQWKSDVDANWLSVSSADCARLSAMRPGTGNVPLISQMRAVQDIKDGQRVVDVMSAYRVAEATLRVWRSGRFRTYGQVPAGFSLLVA